MPAQVQLSGNSLVIIVDGTRISTGISVQNRAYTLDEMKGLVGQAIDVAGRDASLTMEQADAIIGINVTGAARSIITTLERRLQETAGPAAPAERETPEPRPRPRERPREERRAPEERPQERAEEAPAVPEAAPEITMVWISDRIGYSSGRRDRVAAIDALQTNQEYVNRHLAANENERDALTIQIFNSLMDTVGDEFKDYLRSEARYITNFRDLLVHAQENGWHVADDASADVVDAARYYIKYYLYNYAAQDEKLRQEFEQLRLTPFRMSMLDESTIQMLISSLRHLTEDEIRRAAFSVAVSRELDSEAIVAAALCLRRESGRHLSAWEAPEVRPYVEAGTVAATQVTPQPVVPQAAAEVEETPPAVEEAVPEPPAALVRFAEDNWRHLALDVFTMVKDGRPRDLLPLLTTLPGEQSSLEAALDGLGRTDISEALAKVFNEHLRSSTDFTSFAQGNEGYSGMTRESARLSDSSSEEARTAVAHAIIAYVESRRDVDTRLQRDLEVLNERMPEGCSDSLRALLMLSVFEWRRINTTAEPGSWTQPQPERRRRLIGV